MSGATHYVKLKNYMHVWNQTETDSKSSTWYIHQGWGSHLSHGSAYIYKKETVTVHTYKNERKQN